MSKLPRGVNQVRRRSGKIAYSAQITVNKQARKKIFDRLEDAINQRQAWERELGTPTWGSKPDPNEIGVRYSMLRTVEFAGTVDNHPRYKCVCDCGGTITTRLDHLKSGAVRSCGCIVGIELSDDLTGKRYGQLIAVKLVPDKRRGAYWLCECDCGKTRKVSALHLKTGQTVRCQACQAKDLANSQERMTKGMDDKTIDGIQMPRYTDKPNANNTTGYKGVGLRKNGRYFARITVRGYEYRRGSFATAAEAYQARLELEDELLPK